MSKLTQDPAKLFQEALSNDIIQPKNLQTLESLLRQVKRSIPTVTKYGYKVYGFDEKLDKEVKGYVYNLNRLNESSGKKIEFDLTGKSAPVDYDKIIKQLESAFAKIYKDIESLDASIYMDHLRVRSVKHEHELKSNNILNLVKGMRRVNNEDLK